MFIWIVLPFILVSDFYPFFRFGMFAEPIKSNIQTEYFKIEIEINQTKRIIKSEEINFADHHFQYLVRYAYYQKKLNYLFETIEKIINKKSTQKIENIYLLHQIYNQNKKLIQSKTIRYK